ncbi:MAG: NADH-quinone oxidoreductase subunit H [Leptolinea sp.]|jgi:NADH-quinone oxidoreductase subunit H|nr:NADH-quinone oxidoreductase subunit H [Leptolinea sp.]
MADWWFKSILALLIWPGLLGSAVFGWFLLWMSRKFVARLQGRQGPPFFQPFYDFWKLVGKKTIIPKGVNPAVFYALPIISVISIVFALALLPVPGSSAISFEGDLILLVYLLEMPVLMDVIAGYVTRSVYAQIGAMREAVLTIAYNLPFLGALIALSIKLHSFKLAALASAPVSVATILASVALFVALLAQLKVNPFSIPNAEQEIVAGIHIEYNGLPLALFELTHALETSLLVGLISILFMGLFEIAWLKLVVFLAVALIIILLTNITAAGTARLKVQHAFKFYWTWGIAATVLVVAAVLIL